jgi:hypothetical protein
MSKHFPQKINRFLPSKIALAAQLVLELEQCFGQSVGLAFVD